jgi:hypothetical protein
MIKRFAVLSTGLAAVAFLSTSAFAGEVNGSKTNPKQKYAQGRSVCDFSGLNDNPDSTNPANPGGKTQSYGQEVRRGYLDPNDPMDPAPGDYCNPNGMPEGTA